MTYAAGADEQQIALGDNFLSKIVPLVESSQAFRNNGLIVIWTDETEGGAGRGAALAARARESARGEGRASRHGRIAD